MDMGFWKGSTTNLTVLQTVLDVNFKAYVHLTSHALSELEASQGSIIVMSSIAGNLAIKSCNKYILSKFNFFKPKIYSVKTRKAS